MANFILARPYDDGSFPTAGTTATGLGTANLLDDRVRRVCRFSSTGADGAYFTYDLGASKPFDSFRLVALLYSNLSPYRNLLRWGRDIAESEWTATNCTKTETAHASFPIPSFITGSSAAAQYVEQDFQPFASWTETPSDLSLSRDDRWYGGEVHSNAYFTASAYLFACSSSTHWTRLAVMDDGGSILFGVDVQLDSNLSTEGSFEKATGVSASNGLRYGVEYLGEFDSYIVPNIGGVYRVYCSGWVDTSETKVSVRIQTLDANRSTPAMGDRSYFDAVLLEREPGLVGDSGEFAEIAELETPTEFVDNKGVRGPLVAASWAAVDPPSTYDDWISTAHSISGGIPAVSDSHPLIFAPDAVGTGSRFLRVCIDDPDNADGYIDLGRVVVAAPVAPAENFEWGASFSTTEERIASPSRYPVRRPRLRSARFTHTGTKEEAHKLARLADEVGSSSPVLLVGDPASAYAWEETIYGYLSADSVRSRTMFNRQRTTWDIREIEETRR